MDTIERIYKITVDASAAVSQLNRIGDSTEDLGKKFTEFGETAKKFGEALGVAFGAQEIVAQIKETVDALDETAKAAQRVGVASDDLQRLRYAATSSGSSAEDMDKALVKLGQHIFTLGDQTLETTKILKAFGVTSGDTADSAMVKLAEGFAKMPDGISKTAAAMALFGREAGVSLIPTLNQGAKGFQEMGQAADDLGIVMSGNVLRASKEYNDLLDTLGRQTTALKENFVAGLLPGLTSLATEMAAGAKQTDLFRAAGEALGEDLVRLAMGFVVLKAGVKDFLAVQAGVREFATSPIWKWGDAYQHTADQIEKNNAEMVTSLERLNTTWQKTQALVETKFVGPPAPDPNKDWLAQTLAARAAAEKAAADAKRAADEFAHRDDEARKQDYDAIVKLQKDMNTEANAQVNVQHLTKQALDESNKGFEKQAAATLEVGAAYQKVNDDAQGYLKTQQDQAIRLQALQKLYAESTGSVKEWAKQQIIALTPVSDEVKALEAGFDRFVDTLSQGSVTVAQAFKAMAESIVADLLKIWAKKFILDALANLFGGTPVNTDPGPGGGWDAGGQPLMTFARGGILSGPVRMPMALMGEAGPEAVMPLRRGADGRLGVSAAGGGAGALNIAIHNNVGAQISARRDGSGDLQIIVEATKQSLAADVRRGGNDFSRAAEAAWRLSRGAAAPY